MKKQLLKSALIAVAGVGLMAGGALAIPQNNDLQNQLNVRSAGGTSLVNAFTDMLSDQVDSSWVTTATGVSGTTLTFKLGSYNPTISFGIYDVNNITNTLQLFAALPDSVQFAQTALFDAGGGSFTSGSNSATFSSSAFGYYIHVGTTGATYYSDTANNTDQFDHMFAYQGKNQGFSVKKDGIYKTWTPNEYLLAWEDLPYGGDQNFTDYVVMVESVQPVPEPATMLLFGTGLAGLAGIARRRKIE